MIYSLGVWNLLSAAHTKAATQVLRAPLGLRKSRVSKLGDYTVCETCTCSFAAGCSGKDSMYKRGHRLPSGEQKRSRF